MLTQASEQLVRAQAALLAQRVERIAAERIREILGCDVFIRAGADPRLGGAAMSAVLQFFYDVAEAAAQHASRRSAAGIGAGGCASWHAARLAAEQSTKDIAEVSA